MGHAVLLTERIQPAAAFDAERGLQRLRRMIEPGMDHAAVVRGRLLPGTRTPLDDAHLMAAREKRERT